ncbi:hypothetical protein INT45_000065 [Circinella minor]|uniref:OTU domain-containing protein n=1 Tax=Circinella minor TaxID=1195481 RepID=A0A8H7RSJ9_9FUNG|nr:hypothetical protein INT45_000065 [Circinella minor]
MNCEDNKQRQYFINILNSAIESFKLPPIKRLTLPCSVQAKGRPSKRAIGSRLPSGYEIEEKNIAWQIKDSKKILKEKEASKKKKKTSLPEIKEEDTASPNKRSRTEEELIIHEDILSECKVSKISIKFDGWCGFRTVAYFIYSDEDKFLDVKEKMYLYTRNNKELCLDYICGGCQWLYDEILKQIAYGVEPKLQLQNSCPLTYWLDRTTDCQIVANTFSILIATSSSIAPGTKHPNYDSKLFLPFDIPKKPIQPEIMHFVDGNHWESIKRRKAQKMIWPPVSEE